MTDRPILFSGPMVRALVEGRKTQTRRGLNPQPEPGFIAATLDAQGFVLRPAMLAFGPTAKMLARLPRIGDRLWVREAWRTTGTYNAVKPSELSRTSPILFEADGDSGWGWAGKLRPSMFMPRWASRLTIAVSEVRVERLQDISEADAIAEGVSSFVESLDRTPWGSIEEADRAGLVRNTYGSHVAAYHHLWDSLNDASGFGWDANPWVVALAFTVHHQNIDALGAKEAA